MTDSLNVDMFRNGDPIVEGKSGNGTNKTVFSGLPDGVRVSFGPFI